MKHKTKSQASQKKAFNLWLAMQDENARLNYLLKMTAITAHLHALDNLLNSFTESDKILSPAVQQHQLKKLSHTIEVLLDQAVKDKSDWDYYSENANIVSDLFEILDNRLLYASKEDCQAIQNNISSVINDEKLNKIKEELLTWLREDIVKMNESVAQKS